MKCLIIFFIILVESFAQDFRGRAYHEGSLFYIEEHFVLSKFKRRIDYKNPNGKLVGQMWVDTDPSWSFPLLFFWDKRAGVYFGSFIQQNFIWIFNEIANAQVSSVKLLNNKIYFTRTDVLALNKIENYSGIKLYFIFLPSIEVLEMKLKEMKRDKINDEFKFIPVKMKDKLYSPRLYFKFNKSSGKIIEYMGPSEIADEDGFYPRVEIYFDHPEK